MITNSLIFQIILEYVQTYWENVCFSEKFLQSAAVVAAVAITVVVKKLKRMELLMNLHLGASRCHMSYRITQCNPPPNTSEHTLP